MWGSLKERAAQATKHLSVVRDNAVQVARAAQDVIQAAAAEKLSEDEQEEENSTKQSQSRYLQEKEVGWGFEGEKRDVREDLKSGGNAGHDAEEENGLDWFGDRDQETSQENTDFFRSGPEGGPYDKPEGAFLQNVSRKKEKEGACLTDQAPSSTAGDEKHESHDFIEACVEEKPGRIVEDSMRSSNGEESLNKDDIVEDEAKESIPDNFFPGDQPQQSSAVGNAELKLPSSREEEQNVTQEKTADESKQDTGGASAEPSWFDLAPVDNSAGSSDTHDFFASMQSSAREAMTGRQVLQEEGSARSSVMPCVRSAPKDLECTSSSLSLTGSSASGEDERQRDVQQRSMGAFPAHSGQSSVDNLPQEESSLQTAKPSLSTPVDGAQELVDNGTSPVFSSHRETSHPEETPVKEGVLFSGASSGSDKGGSKNSSDSLANKAALCSHKEADQASFFALGANASTVENEEKQGDNMPFGKRQNGPETSDEKEPRNFPLPERNDHNPFFSCQDSSQTPKTAFGEDMSDSRMNEHSGGDIFEAAVAKSQCPTNDDDNGTLFFFSQENRDVVAIDTPHETTQKHEEPKQEEQRSNQSSSASNSDTIRYPDIPLEHFEGTWAPFGGIPSPADPSDSNSYAGKGEGRQLNEVDNKPTSLGETNQHSYSMEPVLTPVPGAKEVVNPSPMEDVESKEHDESEECEQSPVVNHKEVRGTDYDEGVWASAAVQEEPVIEQAEIVAESDVSGKEENRFRRFRRNESVESYEYGQKRNGESQQAKVEHPVNYQEISEEKDALSRENEVLRQKAEQYQNKLDSLSEAQERLVAELRSLAVERDTARSERESLKMELESLSALRETESSMNDKIALDLAALTTERDTLQGERDILQKSYQGLLDRVDLLNEERSALIADRNVLNEDKKNSVSMGQFKSLRKDFIIVTKERDSLLKERSQQLSERAEHKLAQECERKSKELTRLQKEKARILHQRDDAGNRLRTAGTEFARLSERLSKEQERRKKMENEVERMVEEKNLLKTKIEETQSSCRDLEKEKVDLQVLYDKKNGEVARIIANIEGILPLESRDVIGGVQRVISQYLEKERALNELQKKVSHLTKVSEEYNAERKAAVEALRSLDNFVRVADISFVFKINATDALVPNVTRLNANLKMFATSLSEKFAAGERAILERERLVQHLLQEKDALGKKLSEKEERSTECIENLNDQLCEINENLESSRKQLELERASLASVKEELEARKEENVEMQERVALAEKEQAAAEERVRETRAEIETVSTTANVMMTNFKLLEAEQAELKEKERVAEENNAKLNEQMHNFLDQYEKADAELQRREEEVEDELEEVRETLDEYTREINSASKLLGRYMDDKDYDATDDKKKASLTSAISLALTELSGTRESLEESKQQIEALQEELSRVTSSYETSLNETYQRAQKKTADSLQVVISEMEENKKQLKEDIAEFKEAQSAAQDRIAQLEEEKNQITVQYNERTRQLDEAEEKEACLVEQISALEDDLSHRAQINEKQVEERIREVEHRLEQTKREAETHRLAEMNLRKVIEDFQEAKESEIESRLQVLKEELEEAKKLEGDLLKLSKEKKEIEKSLKRRDDDLIRMKAELGKAQEEKIEKEIEIDKERNGMRNKEMVDRRVIRQLLIRFLSESANRRKEVLDLMTKILAFEEDDLVKAGLKRKKLMERLGDMVQSRPLVPEEVTLGPVGSVSDKWIEFLMKETEPEEENF